MDTVSAFKLEVRADKIAVITIDAPGEKMNTLKAEFGNQVRGLIPWPCATAELAGQRFKIYKTSVGTATDKTPGTLLSAGKKGIEVACGDGQSLWITELQAEGGKRMSAAAYLLGHPMNI